MGEHLDEELFEAQVGLLQMFLRRRIDIVASITELLNAQRMPASYLKDGSLLSRLFEDCFYNLPLIDCNHTRLRGRLQELHWAAGFRPRAMPGMHNDLVDPAQMMIRGFHLWQQTRWPGRNARVQYAHTLFNVYCLRCLELLSMRLWDTGSSDASERLSHLQRLLDQLWGSAPGSQPLLVRDARWLIPLAQSPTTDDLAPYFDVMEHLAGSFPDADRLEVHTAAVVMAGGHLRSQLRHHIMKHGVSLEDDALILTSRHSNALDFAVLIQALVPLLEHYERTRRSGDTQARLRLANVICQGVSADPELFVNRIDLLSAYSMIEPLFITTDLKGDTVYTPRGQRHVDLVREYERWIRLLSPSLQEDCRHFRPTADGYSPYGLIYGFSSNLIEHIVLKSLQTASVTTFSLEDLFIEGNEEKLAWVNGWRKLPHVTREMQRLFDYPRQFSQDIFDRIERALHKQGGDGAAGTVERSGRLFIVPEEGLDADSPLSRLPDLAIRFQVSSDERNVGLDAAYFHEREQLLSDRQEGMFLVSYETPGGWGTLSKDILTDVIGKGCDAKIAALPRAAVAALKLMYPALIVVTPKAMQP